MANQPRGKKTAAPPPKKGILGKLRPIELVAIGILVFAVLLYGLSKCGGSTEPLPDNTAAANEPAPTANPDSARAVPTTMPTASLRPLYVILDSIKMRRGPHLDSALVKFLRFGEEVYDMGKRTDFEQTVKISLSETRTAPWVLIRTAENKEGWVFGAGLEFYPKKKPGGNPTVDVPAAPADTAARTTVTPAGGNTQVSSPTGTTLTRDRNATTTTNTGGR